MAKNDFIYIPVGVEHGLSNPRERTLKVIVMGFKIPEGTSIKQTPRIMIANADEVPLQVLGQHGPNIPHRHPREEEIYFVLRGTGEMVAGETSDGKEMRFPVKEGDAFFFAPNSLIGFYSGTREDEQHALILAVRSKLPVTN